MQGNSANIVIQRCQSKLQAMDRDYSINLRYYMISGNWNCIHIL